MRRGDDYRDRVNSVLAGGLQIVAIVDDSPWHHVFATSFQDDDGWGDVGAGTICRGDAVMRVITRVQAATGSAFWSSVKGLTAQVTILIPFIFVMLLVMRIL